MRPLLNITKALADQARLRILMALTEGELCVCQLVALLKLAPSTVSRHIHLLSHAGLIEKRKEGRWNYCRLARRSASRAVRDTLALVSRALADTDHWQRDAARLAKIKAAPLEKICAPTRARCE